MASSYPGGLDAFTNPTATDSLGSATVPHATQHANANDAIEAIQAELGTDPAGASATVKARFDVIEANNWVTTARIADSAVTSGKIADGTIVNADVNAAAAIDLSKLATGALPTGITVASANLVDGTIVDADVNASAAIAQSKIANLTSDLAAKLASADAATIYQPLSLRDRRMLRPRTGEFITADTVPSSSMAMTLNTVYAWPLFVPESFTAQNLTVWCSTTEASSVVRIGAYTNGSTDLPDTLIVDAGTVDTSATTGAKSASATFTVPVGIVWVCAVAQGASSALRMLRFRNTTTRIPTNNSAFSLGDFVACYTMTGISGALPSTWTTASTNLNDAPVIAIRRS